MFVSDNGWRAKIGLLLPSTNTVVEQWFNRMAPEGVSFHSARMTIKVATAEVPGKWGKATIAAAAQLADCRVDAIAHCCTAGSFSRGPDYDQELAGKVKSRVWSALHHGNGFNCKSIWGAGHEKVVSLSPYMDDVQELAKKYF